MVKLSKDYSKKTVTVRDSSWDENETVTLKAYAGDFDRQRILESATEYRRDPDGTMIIVPTLAKVRALKRELAIASWTLRFEDGDPIPLTQELVRDLPTEVASYIDDQITRLWGGLGEAVGRTEEEEALEREDRGTFRGSGDSPAVGAGAPPNGKSDDAPRASHPGRRGAEVKNA